MKDAAFRDLLTSVRQAGAIRRGRLEPARVTTFKPADVKAVVAEALRRPSKRGVA